MSELPPGGWYPDPEQVQTQRYWDGQQWTEQRAPLPGGPTPAAAEKTANSLPGAGWYPDPEQPQTQRYWTGERWTDQRAPLATKSQSGPPPELVFGIGAGVGMIIGAIGPWINAVIVSVGGLEGDGVIVLVAGLIGLVAAAGSLSRAQTGPFGGAALALLLCGLAGAGTSIYDIAQIYGDTTEIFGEDVRVGSPGWGLWLSAVASSAMAVAGVAVYSLDSRITRTG